MNDRKFLFVTCVNDEGLYRTCVRHIQQLEIPPGYSYELFPIRGAASMAAGYNLALSNDAKYKIYLHQDTFILNRKFLYDLLRLFQSYPNLGLLGMLGQLVCCPWSQGERPVGKAVVVGPELIHTHLVFSESTPFQPVAVVDGFLMVTQYDIPWRSDLFTGFHFYDFSQSLEFIKRGYLVGVPEQPDPWAMHYMNHAVDLQEWDRYRKIFELHYVP